MVSSPLFRGVALCRPSHVPGGAPVMVHTDAAYAISWVNQGGTMKATDVLGSHPFLRESMQFRFPVGHDKVGGLVEGSGIDSDVLKHIPDVDCRDFSRKYAAMAAGIHGMVWLLQRDGSVLELGYERRTDEQDVKMLAHAYRCPVPTTLGVDGGGWPRTADPLAQGFWISTRRVAAPLAHGFWISTRRVEAVPRAAVAVANPPSVPAPPENPVAAPVQPPLAPPSELPLRRWVRGGRADGSQAWLISL